MAGKSISLKAYGKINLGLDVLRRLENGYHEVKMIMQSVSLHDVITITILDDTSDIIIRTSSGKIPCNEQNLAYKAAKLMMETYQLSNGVDIYIEKNIPVAAGMAGGSTDCAAVFKGMNTLFEIGASEMDLRTLGVKLGADVPYCIMGHTALSEGIGEVLTPLPQPPTCIVLLAKPDIDVSTKYVYENLHLDTLETHPDIDGMILAIKNQDLAMLCNKMSNVLETVTGTKYPIIGEIEEIMKSEGALQSIMSGSGPTVFGIFDDKQKAEKAAALIRQKNLTQEVHVAKFV